MANTTLLVRRQAEKILELEFKQAQALVNVLRLSRADLKDKLKANPGNWGYQQYAKVIDAHIVDLEARLSQEGRVATFLKEGQDFGHQITGQQANVPRSSAFWEPLPTLPLEALSFEQSRYADLIREMAADHKQNCLTAVRIGISQGEGITPIMNRLLGTGLQGLQGRDGVFRPARQRAEVIGRTVANDLINRGALAGYQQLDSYYPEMGLQKQWVTTSDRRTSNRCESLIGQVKSLEDNFVSKDGWQGQAPPAHPQCRSRVVSISKPYKDEWESKWKTVEKSKDSKTEKAWEEKLSAEELPKGRLIRPALSPR